jgi:hypothetical protein
MILTVRVYPSRPADLLSWDRTRLDPTVPVNTYHDSFGNFCHVVRAPALLEPTTSHYRTAFRV